MGETLKNKICSEFIYDLKPKFFFQLSTIFISCEILEKVWEIMHHPWHCLAYHPGISSNITNAFHFNMPPIPPTLAHQSPCPHWHTTNGLSPIIMNEDFTFQENESYNLTSGINLPSRYMHTIHFGTDTIPSLGPKLWKLIPDKIKHASTFSGFKFKIKFWTINKCLSKLCKIFDRILVLLKFVKVSNGMHTSACSFFLNGGNFLKENLEHLDFLHSWAYNLHKNVI